MQRREKAQPYTLGLMAFFAVLWVAAQVHNRLYPGDGDLWFAAQFLAVLVTPPLWLTFAFNLSRYHYFSRWEAAALVAPSLTLLIAIIPSTQHLIWSMWAVEGGQLAFHGGLLLRANMLMSHLALLAAGLIIARRSLYWFDGSDRTRFVILTLAVIPLLSSIGYLAFAPSPFIGMEPLPVMTFGCALGLCVITEKRFAVLQSSQQTQPNLLAVMSHEARALINGIVGVSDILERTRLNSEQQALIGMMRTSGSTLLHVVNDTLDLERIEAGKLMLHSAPLRIRDCVEQTFENIAVQALTRRLHVGYIMEPAVPEWIIGDERRIRQVLLNLVNNGLKFTQQGGVLIRISAQPTAGNQICLCFAVSDTGIGIPLDKQDQLFTPFGQLRSNSGLDALGSGLGLTISRRLAQLLGGTLTLAASSAQGSTFHFEVPVITAEQPSMSMQPVAKAQRILLCAARSPVQAMAVATAQQAQAQVVSCCEAADAAALLHLEEPFDQIWVIEDATGQYYERLLRLLDPVTTPPMLVISWADRQDYSTSLLQPTVLYQPLTNQALLSVLGDGAELDTAEPAPSTAAEIPDADCLSILVVDDDALNLSVARFIIQSFGHRVDVATSFEAALQALAERSYQVALLDIHMGLSDGRDLALLINEQIPAPQRPYLVAFSGLSAEEQAPSYQAAGFNAWYEKPITAPKLRQLLADYRQHCATAEPQPAYDPGATAEPQPAYDPFTEQAAIDERSWREFTAMSGITPPVIQLFVNDYIADTDQLLREMRSSLMNGDMERIARAAHKLKSSSAIVSANRLADLCHTIDSSRNDTSNYAHTLSMIESEYQRVRAALGQHHSI
ncbi:MAG: response regulator [Oscillochloris sp.]|nr:response regulator [Oscillochloris sp.]